jgi:translation initiation factor 4E
MATATENGAAPAIDEKAAASSGDNEIVTVFHDPENFNVKHPLMNEWTLWFTKPPSGKVRYWKDWKSEMNGEG